MIPLVMAKKEQSKLSFEDALNELENLVEKMEGDEISLEESLQFFERGVVLTRTCQEALSAAEQKVQILTGESQNPTLETFDDDE